MYKDVLLKIEAYKEKILKEMIKKGIYPNQKFLASKVSEIDHKLSVFKHREIIEGVRFNTEEHNAGIVSIMQDLEILNEVVYDFSVKEYNKQQLFISSHLTELLDVVSTYQKIAQFENSTTALGNTLLFKDNDFIIKEDNSTVSIDLGIVDFEEGSSCAFFANINGLEHDNLIFTLNRNEETLSVGPYNTNKSTLKIPGSKQFKSYEIKIQENQIVNAPILLDIPTKIDSENKYTIFCSKNKISVSSIDYNTLNIINVPSDLGSISTHGRSQIDFYIVDGNSVSFKFNKKPLSANFPLEDQRVFGLNKVHHISLEVEDGFSFSVEIDKGEIFAVKETGIVSGDKLYYTGLLKPTDFTVREELKGLSKDYKVKLKMFNVVDNNYDIDSIIIKELGGV